MKIVIWSTMLLLLIVFCMMALAQDGEIFPWEATGTNEVPAILTMQAEPTFDCGAEPDVPWCEGFATVTPMATPPANITPVIGDAATFDPAAATTAAATSEASNDADTMPDARGFHRAYEQLFREIWQRIHGVEHDKNVH